MKIARNPIPDYLDDENGTKTGLIFEYGNESVDNDNTLGETKDHHEDVSDRQREQGLPKKVDSMPPAYHKNITDIPLDADTLYQVLICIFLYFFSIIYTNIFYTMYPDEDPERFKTGRSLLNYLILLRCWRVVSLYFITTSLYLNLLILSKTGGGLNIIY